MSNAPRLLVLAFLTLLGCASESHASPTRVRPNFGDACGAEEACDGEASCIDDARFPGGYCSKVCVDAEESCGEDAACVPLSGTKLCLAACTRTQDCRDDYQCWQGTCRPACASNADCGERGTCSNGECEGVECVETSECGDGQECFEGDCRVPPPRDGGTGKLEGETCSEQSDCQAALVCLSAELGGTCARACENRGDCANAVDFGCTPMQVDEDGDGSKESVATACVSLAYERLLGASCDSNEQCEAHVCLNGECVEGCDVGADCVKGQICKTLDFPPGEFRGCGYADARTGQEILDLGSITVGAGSSSRNVPFAVSPDAASVTLLARVTSGNGSIAYGEVYAPDESKLFDLATYFTEEPLIRWFPSNVEDAATMVIPNTTPDRFALVQGRHAVSLASFDPGDADINVALTAYVRHGAAESGTLGVNIFLVGVGLTTSTAPRDTKLQRALAILTETYAQVGITIGDITYREITGSAASRLQIVDTEAGTDSEKAELLRLSEGADEGKLNFFLIRGFGDAFGSAIGIAGGIGGPPINGSASSGVLVSFDSSVVGSGEDGGSVVGQIMSHEGGHFLGLFHNVELARACGTDEIPTEEDPCAIYGGQDVLSDTRRTDGSNLMYPTIFGADGRTWNFDLSDGQGFVMRRHALVVD